MPPAGATDGVVLAATAGVPAIDAAALAAAREKLGDYADALTLDQRASARRAEELLGWRPRGPGVLEDLRQGSYRERS